MNIFVTKHAILRVMERQEKTEKASKRFIIFLFSEMMKAKKEKQKYKWRKVNIYPKEEYRYLLTDWKHKFLFKKEIWEYVVITYVKKTQNDKYIHSIIRWG